MSPSRSSLAAVLSFLHPGLGHLIAGRRLLGGLVALVVLLVVAFGVVRVAAEPAAAVGLVLDPQWTLLLVALIIAAGAVRVAAIVHSAVLAGWHRRALGTTVVVAVLVLVTAASHAVAIDWVRTFGRAGERLFDTGVVTSRATPLPASSPTRASSGSGTTPGVDPKASPLPTASPAPAQPPSWSVDGRTTILFVGLDSGSADASARTDTLMVVSYDDRTGRGAVISVPRDISDFPLAGGAIYRGKINSLLAYAERHPDQFPLGGMAALREQIGYLLGVPIEYSAAIDLTAFPALIDLVGGVDVVAAAPIADRTYGWPDGSVGFFLAAGPHHLDGQTALAWVRSRKGVGDSDYTRASRQQQLVLALRQRLLDPAMLPRLPDVVLAASSVISTNVPPSALGPALGLASRINDGNFTRVVLGPPYSWHPPTNTTGGIWILRPDLEAIATLSVELFGEESRYYE